ncbi:MAG: DNA repair protein RecN [Betaproteobacteria bacterium]|nr:DNA repair protein RecN [Betaproteobacteria bacterium]
MLRLLSIRDFVVVETLDLELASGFSVLTGETGAGKSILLDALALLLGDRFELRQLRPGASRAELAAVFELDDRPEVAAWLGEEGLAAEGDLLIRRTLDAQGKSRAWINGRPATLAQLQQVGERLVDIHGQHAHQSLLTAEAQRHLVDAFGGFTALAGEVAAAWQGWRTAIAERDSCAAAAASTQAERDLLAARRDELATLGVGTGEWHLLSLAQTRLAHAAGLLETATAVEEALSEGDDALCRRLSALAGRVTAQAVHDPALLEIGALFESARIALDEASRALRGYRDRLELDPAELRATEERLAALHDAARKHRVRPEALPELLQQTESRLTALQETADAAALARRAAQAEADYRALAEQLSAKRQFAASELDDRVTATMQDLAMAGGRFETGLEPLPAPAAFGLERVEFRVAGHPKQPLAPLARVASGGELSRIALAIEVVTAEVGSIPTLIFDEVDVGIGGTVASTVGRLLHKLAQRRQVLCVTHLPQVAACADAHFRVAKHGDERAVRTTVEPLAEPARVEEISRMLAGREITARTRAHARELLEQPRRTDPAGPSQRP